MAKRRKIKLNAPLTLQHIQQYVLKIQEILAQIDICGEVVVNQYLPTVSIVVYYTMNDRRYGIFSSVLHLGKSTMFAVDKELLLRLFTLFLYDHIEELPEKEQLFFLSHFIDVLHVNIAKDTDILKNWCTFFSGQGLIKLKSLLALAELINTNKERIE